MAEPDRVIALSGHDGVVEQLTIRSADPELDAWACAHIYAPYVTDTVVSFELDPPSAPEMAQRIGSAIEWLVAVRDNDVVGYAYAVQHRQRAAYRFACDVSVYVHRGSHGLGVGSELYRQLLDRLERRNYRTACAGITMPNDASQGLHTALGFTRVGVYHAIGWKFDAWHDTLWMQKHLGGSGPPAGEPG